MSWIKEINSELHELDFGKKSARKFAALISLVLIALALYFYWKDFSSISINIILVILILLFISALFFPKTLKVFYKEWMRFALILGWVVSRIILISIFYFILSPTGLIAKIFNKKFLKIKQEKHTQTYWQKKETTPINYEKMY